MSTIKNNVSSSYTTSAHSETVAESIRDHEKGWHGGYYEGDPLMPFGDSGYDQLNFVSMMHTVYQTCIRSFITPESHALEIGCGRGAWTRAMLGAKSIYCLDAKFAEDNNFWKCVGSEHKGKIKYLKVNDFECRDLPDNHFDFLFSFGTFCHIPWDCQKLYYKNLFEKLRPGANAIVMFADFDKYDSAVTACGQFGINVKRPSESLLTYYIKTAGVAVRNLLSGKSVPSRIWVPMHKIDRSNPGMWYSPGIDTVSDYLRSVGWEVISKDVGVCLRDPIVHFRRPAAK